VTLHFLGNVPGARLPELLDGLAVPFAPFELRFGCAELWHNGIAVLAPHEVPKELLALHEALSGARLPGVGLQPEARAYRPHVTMARRAGGAEVPQVGRRSTVAGRPLCAGRIEDRAARLHRAARIPVALDSRPLLLTRAFAAMTIPDTDRTPSATAILVCAAIDPCSGGASSSPA
jgi:hypothetical protein